MTVEAAAPAAEGARGRGLPFPARVYFWLVAAATVIAALPAAHGLGRDTAGWSTFVILAVCAATAQLFVVLTSKDQSYHTSVVFVLAAALLLPPELVALMGVVQHVPEWLKNRYAWYVQSFNICNYTLNALAAWGVAHLVAKSAFLSGHARIAVAGAAACLVFVALQHLLLATMLFLARGHRPGETGLFSVDSLATDLVLAALGVALAVFWQTNPWLLAFAVAPLFLIHRSLHVPILQEQARVDPKTGLFNARHFASVLAEELSRAARFDRPLTLIMADLDLLRDINNTYGHLAGDAVLNGVADVFRHELRHYDVPARFGGEEFAILLPETTADQAHEIADRIRRRVAERELEVETSSEPVRVTISIGIASFPEDGRDSHALVHQADLAVYRAKLQGRNRVLGACAEPLLTRPERPGRRVALPADPERRQTRRRPAPPPVELGERRRPLPHAARSARVFGLSGPLARLVVAVGLAGLGAGAAGILFGTTENLVGLLAITVLVGAGQALALEVEDTSISVGAVGAITGAALFGPRVALALAATQAVVEWSARRADLHQVVFNTATLTLASLGAAGLFELGALAGLGQGFAVAIGVAAGACYYAVNTGLLSIAIGLESGRPWRSVWSERFRWLWPHYLGYGLVGGAVAVAYDTAGLWALLVSAAPLLLMRKTQAAYLQHTHRSAHRLRQAAETVHSQNVSLEQANRLLRERSTSAMRSLSATVDARDLYAAGHSRRVQELALAVGRELGLSQAELDLLGHAAVFHDIGKLGLPDAILLKPAKLTDDEWGLMRRHSAEGAQIIGRLGFLADAVPAIKHHHERFDGAGYPDGLAGEEIPLGARIIHVADAIDSMLTNRVYRRRLSEEDALRELRSASGSQFCPRCVTALERVLLRVAGAQVALAS